LSPELPLYGRLSLINQVEHWASTTALFKKIQRVVNLTTKPWDSYFGKTYGKRNKDRN